MSVAALLDRIRNDRFETTAVSGPASISGELTARELVYRAAWNAGSEHVEGLFLRWVNEARLPAALDELAECEVVP